MKNFCTSFQLFHVTPRGGEYPVRSAYTKSTLRKHAQKLGLSSYCIVTYRNEFGASMVVKKEYYHA